MIPELGHLLLWLATGIALVLAVVPLVGAHKGLADWMALARPTTLLFGLCIAGSMACLATAFVQHDFSVAYVANHSNRALPLAYRLAGVWGGHEGSLLLWALMLAGWMAAVALRSAHLPLALVARLLAVMGVVALGFLLFTLITSNPFERLWPVPPDGRDLNPLLQDPGMVFHPPLLYMGYVGFSVAFAFAVAALIGGELDARWARWSRPWTTAAWVCLTLGIALGSWWAYNELGWGGWWFWDPVENASFMPWLVGTALIHSLAVTEKRGAFKSWTVLLAILAFALSLLGTFLVRSGVLSSVHAFATDPRRGLFILGYLVVVVGAALALYAWRAPRVGLGARFGALSRESLLLANNVLLLVATAAVLLGTLYPLAMDALDLGKISVGAPYFEAVFAPLMAPAVFLMGVGPVARWRQATLPELALRLRWAAAVALLAGVGGSLVTAGGLTQASLASTLGLVMAAWVVATVALDARHQIGPWRGPRRWPSRAWLGMSLAHLGVAVFILGVTVVKTHETERDVRMAVGDGVSIGDLRFTLRGLREFEGPNYRATQGWVEVTEQAGDTWRKRADLLPEKRVYRVQRNPMTEAAIHARPLGDWYVSLGEPLPDGAWTVRVYVKPLIGWIWGGCLLMALGGVVAASDRRYRAAVAQPAAPGLALDALAVDAAAPQPLEARA